MQAALPSSRASYTECTDEKKARLLDTDGIPEDIVLRLDERGKRVAMMDEKDITELIDKVYNETDYLQFWDEEEGGRRLCDLIIRRYMGDG